MAELRRVLSIPGVDQSGREHTVGLYSLAAPADTHDGRGEAVSVKIAQVQIDGERAERIEKGKYKIGDLIITCDDPRAP